MCKAPCVRDLSFWTFVAMNLLDQTFLVLFARQRRENGAIELSWKTARNRMLRYLVLPVVSVVGMLLAAIYPLLGQYPAVERRQMVQLAGIFIWIAAGIAANWRFTRYLRAPPKLSAIETHADRVVVRHFWLASFGIFIVACLVTFLRHRVG